MTHSTASAYPVLLVHGTAFRDYALPLYWGRIPRALRNMGAAVYYGKTDGWGSIKQNGEQLARRIEEILKQTGAAKLHIIAHSKGGLDARYAISACGCADKVATLTTFSTPHRGSRTIDRLLQLPAPAWSAVASLVNALAFLLGDRHPDFITVCRQFSTEYMAAFNAQYPLPNGLPCRSYGAQMKAARSDIFMALQHRLVTKYDGENDGIVGVWSAEFGSSFTLLTGETLRGVSHIDEIDLRRRALRKNDAEGHVGDITDIYRTLYTRLKQEVL